jgi:hypothetical protein
MFSNILIKDAMPYFKFLQGGSFLICSKDTMGIYGMKMQVKRAISFFGP